VSFGWFYPIIYTHLDPLAGWEWVGTWGPWCRFEWSGGYNCTTRWRQYPISRQR
jgi:hypothetical protein